MGVPRPSPGASGAAPLQRPQFFGDPSAMGMAAVPGMGMGGCRPAAPGGGSSAPVVDISDLSSGTAAASSAAAAASNGAAGGAGGGIDLLDPFSAPQPSAGADMRPRLESRESNDDDDDDDAPAELAAPTHTFEAQGERPKP